jgi:hypothetical protein
MIITLYATSLSFWDVHKKELIPKRILTTYIGQSSEVANLTLHWCSVRGQAKENWVNQSQNMLGWLCKMVAAQHLFTGC